jgi:hypothetical protein
MFVGLGVASVVVFDPITTVAAVIAANEPPNELIAKALPMTGVFVVVAVAYVSWLYARKWTHCLAIFVTYVILVGLLGLNVSILGLVEVTRGSAYLIAELFGLIFVLVLVYAAAFVTIERNQFLAGPLGPDAA